MEKPAVMMNEAAFKMLLEALTGGEINGSSGASNNNNINEFSNGNGTDGHDKEVEKLVSEYKNYKKPRKQKAQKPTNQMDKIADIVTNFMSDSEVKTSEQIRDHLETHGFQYDGRAMGPVMRGMLKRNPLIEALKPGEFVLRGTDE